MPVSSEFRRIYARSAARRMPAPAPCWCGLDHATKAGHSAREWQAMSPPDPSTQPARYREWLSWSTHKEQPVTTQPNPEAIAGWGEHARATSPAIVKIITAFNRRVSKIRRMTDIDLATRNQLIALARRDASEHLAPVRADFDRAKEAVSDLAQRAMQPTEMDAATEQRITRAWARVERILDKAPADADKYAIIEDQLTRAKASGDVVSLRALWEGVPGFLESEARDDRGRQEAARLRDVLVRVAAPPEAARAHTQREAFDKGAYRVGVALEQAQYVLSGDAETTGAAAGSLYPGFTEAEMYEVPDETTGEREESAESRLRAMMP